MVVNRAPGNRDLLRARGGFTLIEIMIALTILSIALAAIFSTFNSQHKSYIVQNAVAQMQENVRGGMLYMEDDLRNAASNPALDNLPPVQKGVFGGTEDIYIVSGIGLSDGGANGPDSIFLVSTVSGQEGRTTLQSTPGESIGYAADTDVTSTEGWQIGDIAFCYDDRYAKLLYITNVQNSPTRLNHHGMDGSSWFDNNKLEYPFEAGSTTCVRARLSGYFIKNNPTTGHPQLVRTFFDNAANLTTDSWEIVADDIEDMQVLFGVFDPATGAIAEYDGSHFNANPSELKKVRQIRIQLVGRTASPDPAWNEGPYYNPRYNRTGGITGYDHNRRRPIETVIYLRNWRPTP